MAEIDDAFFDAYVRCFSPLKTVRTRRTPRDMVVRDDDESDGWVEWRLLPGDNAIVTALDHAQRVSGIRLPTSFRRWYASRYTLDMDVSVVRLPANPSNNPAGPLRELLMHPSLARARACGLVPIGDETVLDAGPLCFDARGGGDPDTWPVTFWDHEFDGDREREIGPIIFSSFDRLLIATTAYMERFADVKSAVPNPDDWLDERPGCLDALMAADPDGAGGPGRAYWIGS